MEAGGKDCEDETLQTAFKKLRVDAESLPGAVSGSEAPRAATRVGLETSGAKNKLGCPKDTWHGCTRKSSRGSSRSQRRRRSKSPILHPPKFTYCSAVTLPPPGGCLKQQRLVEPRPDASPTSSSVASSAQKELPSSGSPGHISPLVFGSLPADDTLSGSVTSETTPSRQEAGSSVSPSEEEKSSSDGAESGPAAPRRPAEAADFRALSELHGCCCSPEEGAEPRCRCRANQRSWNGVEVYSFTGLRDVISECERSLPSHEDRTLSGNASSSSSGSPRSCSEQARAYVDDITIEDLSGYMEYYLYIPKKMSHMAEMMYT
ncbi:oxidative stress-responsive serine-rich protein 1 [Acanthochromis polyacanthus]|uniref:oxidative stress-responsive serine-rich protein 1 n=1 Tax=Acanthochromis polyacanthus TaxID=80966 RepID=UPI0022340D03|nr:oxidative stress-responsive serine-rich protein 1 [Acanthochromis polyacanthus]